MSDGNYSFKVHALPYLQELFQAEAAYSVRRVVANAVFAMRVTRLSDSTYQETINAICGFVQETVVNSKIV
jgi:hypothetical protein